MPREYRHIKQYEKGILKLREDGLTYREIGERLGFEQIKIKRFFERCRINQRKLAAGIEIKPKGRTTKRQSKIAAICTAIRHAYAAAV